MKGHARNFMTERVTSVAPDTPLDSIAQTLVAGRFGGVPVVERDDTVLGFVSEGDLVIELVQSRNPQLTARDIMTSEPAIIDEFDTLDEVLRVLRESRVDHLLVTRQGKLVGIITPLDVLRFFVQHVLPVPPEAG